jgi:hypothetical protein
MKVNVNSLSKISHPEKYLNVIDSLSKSQSQLEEHIKKYSDIEDYDKIMKLYEENREIVELFRMFINNKELLMGDILEVIRKHQEAFIKNSNIKQISKKLQIEGSFFGEEKMQSQMRTICDIYAKAQENSNLMFIYDIEKKKFHQIKIEEKTFNAKSFSFYDKESKSVYVSGGMNNHIKGKNFMNTFLQVKVKPSYDDFQFEFEELLPMGYSRAGHNMIQYGEYFIVVGGVNTKKCEIYDKNKNIWKDLPDLPAMCLNPALAIINKFLFSFSGSGTLNSFDSIYMLSLNNLSRIISGDKGFENVLNWDEVDYYFEFGSKGRLRRGMGALTINQTEILIFGGFDYDNIYDTVFDFDLNKEKDKKIHQVNEIKKENQHSDKEENIVSGANQNFNPNIEKNSQSNLQNNPHNNKEDEYVGLEEEDPGVKIYDTDLILPIKTFFNSNLVAFDNYLIMIDGYNNAIELDLKTREFFYYT